MDLKTFLRDMAPEQRETLAARCQTSVGHLRNVSYGLRPCATDLAVRIERESGGAVTRQELRADWADHWPELATETPAHQGNQPEETRDVA